MESLAADPVFIEGGSGGNRTNASGAEVFDACASDLRLLRWHSGC